MTPMTTPFDTGNLGARLKARGLDVVEEAGNIVWEEASAWIRESVTITPNKIDDLVIPALDAIAPYVTGKVDQIDGQIG